ncbi:unnamed protein product [Adineta steineri]|uniref:RING-type domain-containing protein n=1 Tax=Adineta steineri TaxID=433720 RepID=A0A813TTC8_9BILA|nr:unnamed protein product [Adineta steineri]CAF0768644.1 unnamed protein product [Adineta steineri]CAF0813862.1 unnamed protein product [Adineta steineri]
MTTNVIENGYESEYSSSSRSEEDVALSAFETEVDAFTRFIEQQRVEVMFELRHLRFGERPVTGRSNRTRIQTFLNNIQEQQQEQEQQQHNVRVPSTRPIVPSAHIADIDALANRRCVSAALSSASFRQDLENAIRRSIEPRPVTLIQQIPPAPPMPHTFRQYRREQLRSQITQEFAHINREQLHSQITQDLPSFSLSVPSIRIGQERSQIPSNSIHEPFNLERQEREINAWQTITQLQREIIVLEISDLVHRQLVTSALESDFRTHLEQNVLTRLEQGTPPPPLQSEREATAIPLPHTRPTFISNRTTANTSLPTSSIDELSSRLDNMQHMLQLMFSMQMDMQRSLRQEVASSIANNSLSTIPSSSHPINAGHCTICLTAIVDTVLYRCGHLCVCYICGLNLRETTSTTRMKCPICRAPVDDILRVYRSSSDGE